MRGDFLDTNVLFYAAEAPGEKTETADALIRSGGTISVQVLNEFANAARKKMQLDWSAIRVFLEGVTSFLTVEPLTHAVHRRALAIAAARNISLYDALIVSSAVGAGCKRLLTEDMHPGLVIEGRLTIVNPFAQAAR